MKIDFLKRQAAGVEAQLVILQANMDNQTARTRHSRGGSTDGPYAETVNHQIDRTVFRRFLARVIVSGDTNIVEHAVVKRVGLGDAGRDETLRGKHLRDKHANGTATQNDNP